MLASSIVRRGNDSAPVCESPLDLHAGLDSTVTCLARFSRTDAMLALSSVDGAHLHIRCCTDGHKVGRSQIPLTRLLRDSLSGLASRSARVRASSERDLLLALGLKSMKAVLLNPILVRNEGEPSVGGTLSIARRRASTFSSSIHELIVLASEFCGLLIASAQRSSDPGSFDRFKHSLLEERLSRIPSVPQVSLSYRERQISGLAGCVGGARIKTVTNIVASCVAPALYLPEDRRNRNEPPTRFVGV